MNGSTKGELFELLLLLLPVLSISLYVRAEDQWYFLRRGLVLPTAAGGVVETVLFLCLVVRAN